MLSGWSSIPWGLGEGAKAALPAVPVVCLLRCGSEADTGFSSSPISEMLSKPRRSPLELALGLCSPVTPKSPDAASPVPTHGQRRQPNLLPTLQGHPAPALGMLSL